VHERLAARHRALPAHLIRGADGLEDVDDMLDLRSLRGSAGLPWFRGAPVVGASPEADRGARGPYPERVGRLAGRCVGLWPDAACGRSGTTPPELAQKMYYDQQHPIAALMHAFTTISAIPRKLRCRR
jgi:hypothetical protein